MKVDKLGTTRLDRLMQEYTQQSLRKSQSSSGLSGQLRACWYHDLSSDETSRILHSTDSCHIIHLISHFHADVFPVLVLHGRHDRLADPRFGRTLAKRLGGRFIEVDGAHLIKRECRSDV